MPLQNITENVCISIQVYLFCKDNLYLEISVIGVLKTIRQKFRGGFKYIGYAGGNTYSIQRGFH